MLKRRAAVWAAVSGLAGTCMIGISFAINPGPPAGDSGAQLTAFGQQHHDTILWGAWLQAVGPALIAVFALAVVVLAGATARQGSLPRNYHSSGTHLTGDELLPLHWM